MLAASIAICMLIAVCGLLAPAAWRPLILGAMLPMDDFLAAPGPIPISGALLGGLCLLVSTLRPKPAALLHQIATLPGVLLILLVGYDLVAIWMAGTLFEGKFLAMPGESMFQIDLAQPVGLVKSHFNQFVYLIVGCYTALAIPAKFERIGFVTGMNVLDRIFVGLTLSSTFFVVWQLLGEHGVPYPADLIHVGSRAGAFDQTIAGVKRVSGSYAEPSSLGGEVGVALCYLLARSPLATGARLRWVAIAGGLLCIMVSTSTSGLVMLACALACGGMAFILRAASPSQGGQTAQPLKELAAFAPLIGLAVLGSLFLLSLPQTRDVLYEILFNKTRTGSFIERQASNNLAGALFSETSGLGVGLGGHVASSGILTLVACLGLVGLLVTGVLFLRALVLPFLPTNGDVARLEFELVDSRVTLCALAMGFMGAMVVAASPFSSLFWYMAGFTTVIFQTTARFAPSGLMAKGRSAPQVRAPPNVSRRPRSLARARHG